MKAILIDPFAKTISQVLLTVSEGSTYHSMRNLVHPGNPRGYLEHVSLGNFLPQAWYDHGAYIDEEGMLVPWDRQAFFSIGDNHFNRYTLAGRAVIVRDKDDGDSDDCRMSVELVTRLVQWVPARAVSVEAPRIYAADEQMRPVGAPTLLDGVERWTYDTQPSRAYSPSEPEPLIPGLPSGDPA